MKDIVRLQRELWDLLVWEEPQRATNLISELEIDVDEPSRIVRFLVRELQARGLPIFMVRDSVVKSTHANSILTAAKALNKRARAIYLLSEQLVDATILGYCEAEWEGVVEEYL